MRGGCSAVWDLHPGVRQIVRPIVHGCPMTTDGIPRVRRAPLPPDAVLVVRGDVLDPDLLRADARRFSRRYADWDRTGVSAYYARNEPEIDALCQDKLSNYETVVVFARANLHRFGIDIVGTFRTPHVTLAGPDLETLVAALIRCPHESRPNPYYE